MNKAPLIALAATLLAPAAQAGPRRVMVSHVNPPSHASSSGASGGSSAPAASPVFWGTPPSAAPAPAPAAAPAAGRNQVVWGSPLGGARGFSGGGGSRNVNGGSYWGRRILRRDDGGAGSAPSGGGESIPSVLMPGQLIRTAGLGALTSPPDAAPSMFAYEAGPIRYEESKGINLTTHQGLFTGPADTPPPTNKIGVPGAGGGGSSGGNGITENNNVQFNSHSNNGNGNGTGGGNGN